MDQGYFVEFYARADYIKHINTKSGTAFTVGTLSAYVYKHGYTNIKFKCFDEIALEIKDKQWIKGKGLLGYNMAKNQDDYKQLEIVIEEFELADQPPFKDYNKDNQNKTSYQTPKKEFPKLKQDTKDLEDELFGDIGEEDLPF